MVAGMINHELRIALNKLMTKSTENSHTKDDSADSENEPSLELDKLVYQQLKQLAAKYMRWERSDHTLQTTALVNEAFIRINESDLKFNDKSHFYAIAAKTMRRILVDHARHKRREKRGGDLEPVEFHESQIYSDGDSFKVLELNEALEQLARHDASKVELLELKYFIGLTTKEISTVLDLPLRSIERDLQYSKAWLNHALANPEP